MIFIYLTFFLISPLLLFFFVPHGHDIYISYLCRPTHSRQQEFLGWFISTFHLSDIYLGHFLCFVFLLLSSFFFCYRFYYNIFSYPKLFCSGLILALYPSVLLWSNILNQSLSVSLFLVYISLYPFRSNLIKQSLYFIVFSFFGYSLHTSFIAFSSLFFLFNILPIHRSKNYVLKFVLPGIPAHIKFNNFR